MVDTHISAKPGNGLIDWAFDISVGLYLERLQDRHLRKKDLMCALWCLKHGTKIKIQVEAEVVEF